MCAWGPSSLYLVFSSLRAAFLIRLSLGHVEEQAEKCASSETDQDSKEKIGASRTGSG